MNMYPNFQAGNMGLPVASRGKCPIALYIDINRLAPSRASVKFFYAEP